MSKATDTVQDGPTSFVTGGDVSRFQRRTAPPRTSQSAQSAPAASGSPAAPMHVGPTVRVFRGQAETVQPIDSGTRGMVRQQSKGIGNAAGAMGGATAASMIAG